MVIVQGSFRLEPAGREAFLTQSLETMRASRNDKGCLEYVIAADPLDPGRVVVSERWESIDDLNEHTARVAARAREAAASRASGGSSMTERELRKYHIESVEDMI